MSYNDDHYKKEAGENYESQREVERAYENGI